MFRVQIIAAHCFEREAHAPRQIRVSHRQSAILGIDHRHAVFQQQRAAVGRNSGDKHGDVVLVSGKSQRMEKGFDGFRAQLINGRENQVPAHCE
jgi:hypothetical protein